MNEASARRLAVGREVAALYAVGVGRRMALVGGSAARGDADAYSDLDLALYWDTPDAAWLESAPLAARGGERFTFVSLFDGEVFVEQYMLGGLKVDVAHISMAWWQREVDDVLERLDTSPDKQDTLDGFLCAAVLDGEAEYARWRQRLAAYPDALALKMVRAHLSFYPQWVLEQQGLARGELLSFYDTTCEMLKHVLGVLAGLNRVYFGTEKPKHLAETLGRMPIRPARTAERIQSILAGERAAAPAALATLTAEVLDLVEQHLPEVDTARARWVQAMPLPPWP